MVKFVFKGLFYYALIVFIHSVPKINDLNKDMKYSVINLFCTFISGYTVRTTK